MNAFPNTLGLPWKYALIGAVGLLLGTLPSYGLGVSSDAPGLSDLALAALAGGVGGCVGGLLRARRGKKS